MRQINKTSKHQLVSEFLKTRQTLDLIIFIFAFTPHNDTKSIIFFIHFKLIYDFSKRNKTCWYIYIYMKGLVQQRDKSTF